MKSLVRLGAGGTPVPQAGDLLHALSLSVGSGRSFHWKARGERDALDAERLAYVRLFTELSAARSDGDSVGSRELFFAPGHTESGELEAELGPGTPVLPVVHAVAVVCQSLRASIELHLRGVTHPVNECTFEESSTTWRHLVAAAGVNAGLRLERAGFAPRGGGVVVARLRPAPPSGVSLSERGELTAVQILSAAARLPAHVHQRQAARARSGVSAIGVEPAVQLVKLPVASAGSTVAITGLFSGVPLTVAATSSRGRSVESVGRDAAAAFRKLYRVPAVVPPRLVVPVLLALSQISTPAFVTTWQLPPEIGRTGELLQAFLGRGPKVSGRVGQPARIDFEAASSETRAPR